jgi:hypothetical protein
VLGRMILVQNESFDVRRAEMEDARFMVVDPNDRMIMMLAHGNKSFSGDPANTRTGVRMITSLSDVWFAFHR